MFAGCVCPITEHWQLNTCRTVQSVREGSVIGANTKQPFGLMPTQSTEHTIQFRYLLLRPTLCIAIIPVKLASSWLSCLVVNTFIYIIYMGPLGIQQHSLSLPSLAWNIHLPSSSGLSYAKLLLNFKLTPYTSQWVLLHFDNIWPFQAPIMSAVISAQCNPNS